MNQDERGPFDEALRHARESAYGPGEFVGQESFMRASEILCLTKRAGITSGTSVLDLCCGVAGPGLLIARTSGCRYLGVDSSASAIRIACKRAGELNCRFVQASVPPLPDGRYDVVLLLETMLAFREKEPLVRAVSSTLGVGGRFAFTFEEGEALAEAERARMPDVDTVWLTPLPEVLCCLEKAGFRVLWSADQSAEHQATVEALLTAYTADAEAIASRIGDEALDDLLRAHCCWRDWLQQGRVRKFAVMAEKTS